METININIKITDNQEDYQELYDRIEELQEDNKMLADLLEIVEEDIDQQEEELEDWSSGEYPSMDQCIEGLAYHLSTSPNLYFSYAMKLADFSQEQLPKDTPATISQSYYMACRFWDEFIRSVEKTRKEDGTV